MKKIILVPLSIISINSFAIDKFEFNNQIYTGIEIGRTTIGPVLGIDLTDKSAIKFSSLNNKYYNDDVSISSLNGNFKNYENNFINTIAIEYFPMKKGLYGTLGMSFNNGSNTIFKNYNHESIANVGNDLTGTINFETERSGFPLFLGIGYRTKNKGLNFGVEAGLSYFGSSKTKFSHTIRDADASLSTSSRENLENLISQEISNINKNIVDNFLPKVNLLITYSF